MIDYRVTGKSVSPDRQPYSFVLILVQETLRYFCFVCICDKETMLYVLKISRRGIFTGCKT